MKKVVLTQGDTRYVFKETLSWPDGTAVDLEDATIKFILRPLGEPSTALVRDATNPTGSDVEYQVVAEDVAVTGKFWRRWKVTFPAVVLEDIPARIQNFPADEYDMVEIIGKLD